MHLSYTTREASEPGTTMHALRNAFILVSSLAILTQECAGQNAAGASPPRVNYPSPLSFGEWQGSVGLALTTLPNEIVEEEMNQSPAIDFISRLGMPCGFSVDGHAQVQVLTNHLSLGARWSHAFGRFAFSIGDDIAWWFGFLTIEGFNNSADGWLNYPSLSLGYDFGHFRLAVRAEAVLVMSYSSFAGDNKISTDKNSFSGVTLGFAVEQPFWKNTHVTLGFKASYLRFFYQSWFVYETFRRYLFIPEISVGFML